MEAPPPSEVGSPDEGRRAPAAVAAHLVVPPGVKVHTKAEPGDPVTVLEGSARQAAMLVLGRDRLSWGSGCSLAPLRSRSPVASPARRSWFPAAGEPAKPCRGSR